MCIICAKKKGIEMPDWNTIETMWYNNSDGAGLMWLEDGVVRISKGFMKYNDFRTELETLGKRLDLKETPVVMHFRITTHGGTKPENCHPFPITDQIGLLQKLRSSTDVGVAHNGILSFTPRTGISDTMEYIATQLAVIKKMNRKFLQHDYLMQLIKNATAGSRLCFLDKYGRIFTTGNFIEEDGVLYSNNNYKYNYYDWGFSSKKTKSKLLCDVNDVDVYVKRNGSFVNTLAADYYIDRNNDVYSYNYAKDVFSKVDGAKAVAFCGGGFDNEKAFAGNVEDENENCDYYNFWTDYLCPFEGVVRFHSGEELEGEFLINEKGDVYEEVDYQTAILLPNVKALTYDGLTPLYHDKLTDEFVCCLEEDYYGY